MLVRWWNPTNFCPCFVHLPYPYVIPHQIIWANICGLRLQQAITYHMGVKITWFIIKTLPTKFFLHVIQLISFALSESMNLSNFTYSGRWNHIWNPKYLIPCPFSTQTSPLSWPHSQSLWLFEAHMANDLLEFIFALISLQNNKSTFLTLSKFLAVPSKYNVISLAND
jgi:hypothetical protein